MKIRAIIERLIYGHAPYTEIIKITRKQPQTDPNNMLGSTAITWKLCAKGKVTEHGTWTYGIKSDFDIINAYKEIAKNQIA